MAGVVSWLDALSAAQVSTTAITAAELSTAWPGCPADDAKLNCRRPYTDC
jgi:hypothetical protein